jgi:hypothetical protein
MALTDARWSPDLSYDLHVVAGETRELADLIEVYDDTAEAWVSVLDPTVVPKINKIGFIQLPAPAASPSVTVTNPGGTLAVSPAGPHPFLKNFLVSAVVVLNPPGPPWVSRPVARLVRVHAHHSIKKIWVAPNPLTVRQGGSPVRFSVLAEFSDESVGDVSRHPGLAWSGSGAVSVNSGTGELAAGAPAGSTTISTTLTTPAGPKTASATANAAPPWSAPIEATLIAGNDPANADIPNVIFLAEGFTAAQQDAFTALTLDAVTKLREDPTFQPFGLLSASINYWRVFLPSNAAGLSVLPEVAPETYMPGSASAEVPLPELVSPEWKWPLLKLIAEVGLPVPGDASFQPAAAALALKIIEWNTVRASSDPVTPHMTDVDPAHPIQADVYKQWELLAGRRLIDDRDTAFGLADGDRPNLAHPSRMTEISWHPLRTKRADLDQLLGALTYKGATIGQRWVAQGPNRHLIFFLCAGGPDAGTTIRARGEELVAVSISDELTVKISTAPANAAAKLLEPHPLPEPPRPGAPSTISSDTLGTIFHESCHALIRRGTAAGLHEEYGTRADGPRALPNSSGELARVRVALNVQDIFELEKQAGNKRLDGGRIKWRWPRIVKAGVTAAKPQGSGTKWQVVLERQPAEPFKLGDVVQFRVRPLSKDVVTSPPFDVSLPAPFKVTTPVAGTMVSLTLRPGGDLTTNPALYMSGFNPGSVLFVAARAPAAGGALGDALLLVAKDVEARITSSEGPLNADPQQPTAACGNRPHSNYPSNLSESLRKKVAFSDQIVGVYDGGAGFDCDAFHPAGECTMQDVSDSLGIPGLTGTVNSLCHVCRYALVDEIDPTQHGPIDKLYRRSYPG